MKKKILIVATLALALAVSAFARGRSFGLGGMLGDPTGFSAKYWTSGNTALDFGLGWSGNYFYGRGYYDDRCYKASFRASNPWCYDERYAPGDYGWRVFHFHGDYLFHNFDLIKATERFPIFYGPGLEFNYVDYDFAEIGIRGDFGIAWLPRRAPLDVFFELGPGFIVIPYPDFDLDASIGMRFYF